MEPSSTDLRYFLEVVKSGSLSKASEVLGITQPSLTLAIQRIERFLGEKVLIRSRSGTTPTNTGRVLMGNSKRLIEAWDEVKAKVQKTQTELTGRIVLGCHPEVAIDSLPLFLPDLLESYPQLEIDLEHALSREITEKVINSEIDIGIVVNPKKHPDLVIRPLSKDEVNFWVGPGKNKIQTLPSGEAVLFCDLDLLQTQVLMKRAEKKGMKFSRIISSSDLEVVMSAVASGAGIGLLPSEVASRYPESKLTRVLGVEGYADTVSLIVRVENRSTRSIRIITDLIEQSHRKKYGVVRA